MSPTPLGTCISLSRRLAGSALSNARVSLDTIAGAVADRRELQEHEQSHKVGDLQRHLVSKPQSQDETAQFLRLATSGHLLFELG